jgi:hypothetical protein
MPSLPATTCGHYCRFSNREDGRAACDDLSPVHAPTLALAAGDEYMAVADAFLAWLAPTKVTRRFGQGHYEVLRDETVKREVAAFLAGEDHDRARASG